ncbi:molybdopterin biosynthesis protein MoeB [Serratia rubidaea]|uniref:Molybdopterin biosynthesis protein MoeB n=1 Tax=Serratia rubidaea TaxID=61652 RepID=A0A447QJ61_SERRU|nr:molybdopterin biosynthesis protein MoeB [Serratia rubidaea]
MTAFVYRDFPTLRAALVAGQELALIDVREEAEFAASHPLFAVNIPLSKLELEIYRRIPRRTTPIVVYDAGEGLAEQAAGRLRQFGYDDVALLSGGLAAGVPPAVKFFRT